jgi:hypothetical protein
MQAAVISFVHPATTRKLSYRDQHNQLHAALSDHPVFHDGHILDTLERGGLPLSSCFRPAAIFLKDCKLNLNTLFLFLNMYFHLITVAHPVLHIKELAYIKELAKDHLEFVEPCSLGPHVTVWQGKLNHHVHR